MFCCCSYVSALLGLIGFLAVCRSFLHYFSRHFLSCFPNTKPLAQRFGEVAVVTGATDGIGEAIALGLAKSGMKLLLVGRSYSKLMATKSKIAASGASCDTFEFDFSSEKWNEEQYKKLETTIQAMDVGVLVNCAGVSYPSALRLEEVTSDLIDDMISINVKGSLRLTHSILPKMRERKRGAIICIGSGASELPTEPLYAAYVATKAALVGFCRSLQAETASDNVIVQCITPLLVTTKLSKIRTPSLTVPSPERFASCVVDSLRSGCATTCMSTEVSPFLPHSIILFVADMIPLALWNRIRLGHTSSLRKRYLNKKGN